MPIFTYYTKGNKTFTETKGHPVNEIFEENTECTCGGVYISSAGLRQGEQVIGCSCCPSYTIKKTR